MYVFIERICKKKKGKLVIMLDPAWKVVPCYGVYGCVSFWFYKLGFIP